ncbi:hypothetical protein [Leptospira santarosai]|uniref:hypothetical protein n=1 Tax=Leptospira santarosai TaxID=28183 RepID=UPI0024AEDBC9|nr:hypothetical protein [Leptospira santarosai]MBW9234074.1 hypothetical protein [Leptospira santarosai]MDI7175268.1 hypothetical protein [Leptospira santarosai]MDI7194946.1 hypothetical protein [Leptospira santarosai]MDO6399321.1 hypothetical protein [Leptospira santarosai]MDO6404787.1 hypothetical protein [Leptospira santarosai]
MKHILVVITLCISFSLYSVDKENNWSLDTKELKCKNVSIAKQDEKVDISLSGIKKSDINCRNQKVRKLEGVEDISTITCAETEYFYMSSEERCNQLYQFISISAKTWYTMLYSLDKKDSPARCISTVDPAIEKIFGPSHYVFKEGCKVLTYEPNAGLLSIDCSKNKTFSSMPTLFYADSEALCSNIKEHYDKK